MNKNIVEQSFKFALLRQFDENWRMLEEAIAYVPLERWHEYKGEWSYSWLVYHIIETANFYSQDHPDKMKWNEHIQINWKEDSEDIIREKKDTITKELTTDYLKKMKTRIKNYLQEISDVDLLKKDGFHWFSSIYEKLVYLLRHNSYHLGELARMLREWDCKRIKW